MKFGKNKPTPHQNGWAVRLKREGYACALCYSAKEAIEVLKWYVNPDLDDNHVKNIKVLHETSS